MGSTAFVRTYHNGCYVTLLLLQRISCAPQLLANLEWAPYAIWNSIEHCRRLLYVKIFNDYRFLFGIYIRVVLHNSRLVDMFFSHSITKQLTDIDRKSRLTIRTHIFCHKITYELGKLHWYATEWNYKLILPKQGKFAVVLAIQHLSILNVFDES